MNAIFDMGYYQEIKLVNAHKLSLVTLSHQQVLDDIPEWFVNMIPMKAATAASEAYEQAKLIGKNSYYIRTGSDQAKDMAEDMAEWKALVFDIVDNQKYKLSFIA